MRNRTWVLAGITLAATGGLACAPFLGVVSLSDFRTVPVFWQIRAPRAVLAFLAGSGLAMAGMTFQAMFRNALATPFTLGVSSGAAFGATIAIRLGWTRAGMPA